MVNLKKGFVSVTSDLAVFSLLLLFENRLMVDFERGFAPATCDLAAFALILFENRPMIDVGEGFAFATCDLAAFSLILILKIEQWLILEEGLQLQIQILWNFLSFAGRTPT